MQADKQTNLMTCSEFAEILDSGYELMHLMDEQYWDGGFNANACFDLLLRRANEHNVTLTDADSWDYDSYFYNVYVNTEKGLS